MYIPANEFVSMHEENATISKTLRDAEAIISPRELYSVYRQGGRRLETGKISNGELFDLFRPLKNNTGYSASPERRLLGGRSQYV